jgi:hypothetical protein
MILNNSLKLLSCLLIVCLCAVALRAYLFIDRVEPRATGLLNEGQTLITVGNKSISSLGYFADLQIEQLQSPRSQKAMQAGIETLAVFNATGRLINNQLLPRAMKNLDSSDSAIRGAGLLVASTNKSLNGEEGLLPALTNLVESLTETAGRFNLTVDTLNLTLKQIADKTGKSLDEIYLLLSSPEWKEALSNVAAVTGNLSTTSQKIDATAEQIRLAMERAPGIAASLDKIASTSSKFSKATLIANLLSIIAKTFLP